MLLFNNAVGMGVVQGYVDVVDTIPVRKPVQGGDVGSTIVGDDFLDGTPSA